VVAALARKPRCETVTSGASLARTKFVGMLGSGRENSGVVMYTDFCAAAIKRLKQATRERKVDLRKAGLPETTKAVEFPALLLSDCLQAVGKYPARQEFLPRIQANSHKKAACIPARRIALHRRISVRRPARFSF